MISLKLLVVAMVGFGALNTLVRKAQLVTCSSSSFPVNPDLARECTDPTEEPFNKPWIGNLFMFAGELLLFSIVRTEQRVRNTTVLVLPELPWHYFALPASLDVIGSGLSGIGMLFISASVWQMMRGSLIVYTAVLSVVFLKRKLEVHHVSGLLLASAGLALVGVSSYLDSRYFHFSEYSSLVVVGIGLTVLSQLCSAVQIVVEESMMKETEGVYSVPSPARMVAFEGFWGVGIMAVLLVGFQLSTGTDHGSIENSVDSGEKLLNSYTLIILVFVYLLSIALFNVLGMTVSKRLSSVHRTLIDSSRSVVVWAVQLILFHWFESKTYGTAWTRHSWLQLIGFVLLVLGTLVHNEVISWTNPSSEEDPILRQNS